MKKTPTKLKSELDKIFSRYVRLSRADPNGLIACYTCGYLGHWKKMQNGHMVSRYYLATRYDERNCRPQCYTCNMWRNGMIPNFSHKLEHELGKGITEKLYAKAREITKDFPYEEKIEFYKKKVKRLESIIPQEV